MTLNRLCASGLDAVAAAARAIKLRRIELAIAGGVESMSRAPFVMGKAEQAFQRTAEIHDTTIGWRFINPLMKEQYGVNSMPETGENVGAGIPGEPRRPGRVCAALAAARRRRQAEGRFDDAIVAVEIPGGRAGPTTVDTDEHPRADTTVEALSKLKPIVRARWNRDSGQRLGRQ